MAENVAGHKELFECAIHLGPFERPKLLDCHHTFCKKCLEDLAGASNSIRCPLCTKISKIPAGGVNKFSTNFYLSDQPTSSAQGRDDKEYCPKHPDDLLKCFCEDCNIITCSTCLLRQHKNHKYLIIQDSKEAIFEKYKNQKDRLNRKLDELKKVKEIGEESLKKIVEHRQTALNDYQTELQRNYDKNHETLNTVLSKVNTQKSQIETSAAVNPDAATTKTNDVLRAVLIMKEIHKDPSISYLPPMQYLKFNKKEESRINLVGRLESVTLSIPYTNRNNTTEQQTDYPFKRVQPRYRTIGKIGRCILETLKAIYALILLTFGGWFVFVIYTVIASNN